MSRNWRFRETGKGFFTLCISLCWRMTQLVAVFHYDGLLCVFCVGGVSRFTSLLSKPVTCFPALDCGVRLCVCRKFARSRRQTQAGLDWLLLLIFFFCYELYLFFVLSVSVCAQQSCSHSAEVGPKLHFYSSTNNWNVDRTFHYPLLQIARQKNNF